MDISIIICCRNNAERLRQTLTAIGQCRVPEGVEWEVICVNHRSTDHTGEVAKGFLQKIPLKYAYEGREGQSHARNRSLQMASGALLIFTDDDVDPVADWLVLYWEAFQQKSSGYYFGAPVDSNFERPPGNKELLSLAPYSVTGLDWGSQARELVGDEMFIGPNWAAPAAAIREVGAFNTKLGLNVQTGKDRTGEETDLMERLQQAGWRPWYIPQARVRHFVPAWKCDFGHIMDRRQGWGYDNGLKNVRHYENVSGKVPLWMYRKLWQHFWSWLWCRLRLKPGYREYAAFIYMKGFVEGFRDYLAERNDSTPTRVTT